MVRKKKIKLFQNLYEDVLVRQKIEDKIKNTLTEREREREREVLVGLILLQSKKVARERKREREPRR